MTLSLLGRCALLATAATAALQLASSVCRADSPPPPAMKAVTPALVWRELNVELPSGDAEFPAGPDADLASVHCLICHSAAMVLSQPALTKDQWRAEVVKMRSAFGALIPADQVEALTEYLYRLNGR